MTRNVKIGIGVAVAALVALVVLWRRKRAPAGAGMTAFVQPAASGDRGPAGARTVKLENVKPSEKSQTLRQTAEQTALAAAKAASNEIFKRLGGAGPGSFAGMGYG